MIIPSNIVWNKTKKNVEETISKYIYYNLSVDNNPSCKINESFILSKLEKNDNMYNVIKEEIIKERINYINHVRTSFNKLTSEERKIIFWTYLDEENKYDDRYIANSLGFSLGYYYKKKKETLIRFAYSLGIEVINN